MTASAAVAVSDPHVRMRAPIDADRAFVQATWRESWKLASENRRSAWRTFKPYFRQLVVDGILAQPDTKLVIGCLPEDPGYIACWCCYTPGLPTVHYVYVRHDVDGWEMRRRGLMAVMLSAIGVRDGGQVAYTFKPQEHSHEQDGRSFDIEQLLLKAAERRGVVARYVSPSEFMGRR